MSANRQHQEGGRSRDRFEDYVPVAERVERFYERYPDGRITTAIAQHDLETGFVLMRAEVFRTPDDAQPAATGHAYEVRGESHVNRTSYVENCETSCVGRALALLGFEIKRGVASREEMQKAARGDLRAVGGGGKAAAPAPAKADGGAGGKGKVVRLTDLHRKIRDWRKKIMDAGVETESVLNDMLGGYGCAVVEELDQKQALDYGKALKEMFDKHEARQAAAPDDY
jgi:hypothetical protein